MLHNEETNVREKEKAHKYYERQLKASSWYIQPPQRTWIEIVEPDDGEDTCSQCYYDDACGCVLVSNHGNVTPASRKSGRSSFGDTLSVCTRASGISKNSTEDEKSFYDNLCQFCKITSLERRTKKYGEWRRRFSAKLAEARSQDDGEERRVCTCAMNNLSFMEWKKIYEQEELIKLSKADHFHEDSQTELHSDYECKYDTQKSEMHSDYGTQKSKDSASHDYPSLTVNSSSLGYNSLSSIPYTERDMYSESDYTSTDASEYEEYGNECTGSDLHAGRTRLHPASRVIRGAPRDSEDEVFSRGNSTKRASQSKRHRRARYRNSNSLKTKAHLHKERPTKLQREVTQNNERSDRHEFLSEGGTKQTRSDDKDCTIPDAAENPAKVPMENDETIPPDLLSEFLTIARTIDEFYESVHAKKFLENRILDTSRERLIGTSSSRDHVDVTGSSCDRVNDVTSSSRERFTTSSSGIDMTSRESVVDRAGTENFSAELRKRIRSLERLCSFVEYSDEEESELGGSLLEDVKELGKTPKEETPVWRLSQQSINLTLSRRSRSGTSSDSASGRSRLASTSGSGSGNSRCSTRQGNYKNPKPPSITSVENLKSPDSGFSDSLTGLNSADTCQLGTKWAGSMQWDYSDWHFYYGVPCDDEQIEMPNDHTGLMTIDEARPQDPLDWDW